MTDSTYTKDARVDRLYEYTCGGYSWDRYGESAWRQSIRRLAGRGHTDREIVAVMLSKWTRWAGDASDKDYGKVTSMDLLRFMDQQSPDEVAALAREHFSFERPLDWCEDCGKGVEEGLGDSEHFAATLCDSCETARRYDQASAPQPQTGGVALDLGIGVRTYAVVRYDVSDLTQAQRDALIGEATAQAEESDDHPGVAFSTSITTEVVEEVDPDHVPTFGDPDWNELDEERRLAADES